MSPASRFCLALCLGAALLSPSLRGDEKQFTETLSAEQQKAAGIAHLKPGQVATLNNLVERELILAKEGDTPGFSADFSHRRSAPELAKAGIDALTPDERKQLDTAVALAIANQPRTSPSTLSSVRSDTATIQAVGPRPEIHGAVSFTVGTSGRGRNFYGGTVELEQVDPAKGYGISIAYSEFHGKGMYSPYEYGYGYGPGYGYGCGPGRFW